MGEILPGLLTAIEGVIEMLPGRILLGAIALAALLFAMYAIRNHAFRVEQDSIANQEQDTVAIINAKGKSKVSVSDKGDYRI